MRGEREPCEGTVAWDVADAVFAGRDADWEVAIDETPSELRPLLQELRSIAELIAAHEDRQRENGPAVGEDLRGAVWGPLEIVERIGSGAFGEVFRAREPRLDRQVAVKFFRPHRLSAAQLSSDVIEEGRLLARVRHPNVVTVFGAKHLDGRFGIWMEYIDGATLEETVAEQGPLDATEAAQIGRDLCSALTALHDAEILHRDIKARNVMRERSGRVVLMDLGVSCEIDSATPIRQYGTPLYAAPEVLLDGKSSRQGDIYSLGVLLYFLASGTYPVSGARLADIQQAHERGRVEPLSGVRPDLPDEFVRIVEKALARNRYERFATAAEMEQALELLVSVLRSVGPGTRACADEEAQKHYLMGQSFWAQRSRGGLPKALECYRQAVAKEPGFAPAYVGIARCLGFISYWQYVRPRDGYAQMRSAAERALALDPGLGEAHTALGCVHEFHDWDALAAERECERAVQLAPNYYTRSWYALLLSTESRHDEAIAMSPALAELDPTSLIIALEAIALSHAGRLEEALEIFRMGLEADPDSLPHHNHIGLAYILAGKPVEAEAFLKKALVLSRGEDPWTAAILALLYTRSGRDDEAHELIAHNEELAQRRYVSFFCQAIPWIGLGRDDMWEPLMEKAIEERDTYLVWMRSLGGRIAGIMVPRFVEMLDGAGLLEWPLGASSHDRPAT